MATITSLHAVVYSDSFVCNGQQLIYRHTKLQTSETAYSEGNETEGNSGRRANYFKNMFNGNHVLCLLVGKTS